MFAIVAVTFGFFFALLLAVSRPILAMVSLAGVNFRVVMRGSPLILQFFFAYALILMLPREASIQLLAWTWCSRLSDFVQCLVWGVAGTVFKHVGL